MLDLSFPLRYVDLAGLYRVWNPRFKTWSVFGQDHVAQVLLGWGPSQTGHNAVEDAVKSMRLFNYYRMLQVGVTIWVHDSIRPHMCLRVAHGILNVCSI